VGRARIRKDLVKEHRLRVSVEPALLLVLGAAVDAAEAMQEAPVQLDM
jgi:hypothetical protein